jgi:hypothetical protein
MSVTSLGGPPLQRGGFIEYTGDAEGTIKSWIFFQFNPENLTRTIEMPQITTSNEPYERGQAGEKPVEKITLVAQFSAADSLGVNNPQSRLYGIAPLLAILQKMTTPEVMNGASSTKAVDKTGDAAAGDATSKKSETKPIPRIRYPKILFVWGTMRVLPVRIDSMSIKEQQFDANLNPVQAEVTIGLAVYVDEIEQKDKIAHGALAYTDMMEQTKAAAGLFQTGQNLQDIINF